MQISKVNLDQFSFCGQLIVRVADAASIPDLTKSLRQSLPPQLPNALVRVDELVFGPPAGAAVAVRFSGPNPIILRALADEAFRSVRDQIEAISLPAGYTMEGGGEFKSASVAQASLGKQLPLGFLVMLTLVLVPVLYALLFRIRPPRKTKTTYGETSTI